jgi:alkaline phosphatase D
MMRPRFFSAVFLTFLLAVSCTSASREGLPPGSPFAESTANAAALLPEGTAVGDVTSRSAVLWLRTEGPKAVQVEWASIETWKRISAMASVRSLAARTAVFVAGPESDYTLSIPLEGLEPETRYRYHILVDAPDHTTTSFHGILAKQGEFTTLPDPATSVPLTFAWSGDLGGQHRCRQGPMGYPIFDQIRARRPDFFVFLGDTIYSDDVCPVPPNEPGADFKATTLTEYRARQRYQRGAEALRRFLEEIPVYVTWDDHEVKNNFSGPFESQMPAGRQALREYWPIRMVEGDPHRLYRKIRYGADIDMFLLDTRQYRSRNADLDGPKKTMLGARQLKWLLDELHASDATWKVIVTSVPLSIPKGGRGPVPGYDGWAGGPDGTGFERERQVIVDAILASKAKNVVFLAADVHFVQANSYDPNNDGVPDFHEFVAGPLSAMPGRLTPPSPSLHPKNLINEGGYDNFGLVQVTSNTFEVTVIDDAGKSRFSHKIVAQ